MQPPTLQLGDMHDAHNGLPLGFLDLEIDNGEATFKVNFVRVLHEVSADSVRSLSIVLPGGIYLIRIKGAAPHFYGYFGQQC